MPSDQVTIYDIGIDARRPVTQADADYWEDLISILQTQRTSHEDIKRPSSDELNFRLACYTNPMRSDGLFVAEDKPVLPYEGARGLNGEPLYPSIPLDSRYFILHQLPPDFARELVRRWNHFAPKG